MALSQAQLDKAGHVSSRPIWNVSEIQNSMPLTKVATYVHSMFQNHDARAYDCVAASHYDFSTVFASLPDHRSTRLSNMALSRCIPFLRTV